MNAIKAMIVVSVLAVNTATISFISWRNAVKPVIRKLLAIMFGVLQIYGTAFALDCSGNACGCVDWEYEGRQIDIYNECDSAIKASVNWGGVMGCGPRTEKRIRSGSMKTFAFPNRSIIGICNIRAVRH